MGKIYLIAFLLTINFSLGFGILKILEEFATIGRQELWDRGKLDFFGYECNYSRAPKFSGLKLEFAATVHCPGFTPYTGHGRAEDPEVSVNLATIDFVRKSRDGNFLTEEEARPWLG